MPEETALSRVLRMTKEELADADHDLLRQVLTEQAIKKNTAAAATPTQRGRKSSFSEKDFDIEL